MSVTVGTEWVSLEGVRLVSPPVVAYFQRNQDPTETLTRVMDIGVEVLNAAETSLDAELVARKFEELERRLSSGTDAAIEQLLVELNKNLDKFTEQRLREVLTEHQSRLERGLADVFDPASVRSIQKQVD